MVCLKHGYRLIMAVAAAAAVHGAAFAAQPEPATRVEVPQLLNRLGASGCTFQRNGSWHSAPEAQAHLEKKYNYLLDKGKVRTTEDFIELAATRSSMSGTAYQVRCGTQPVVPSAAWLRGQLREVRQQKR